MTKPKAKPKPRPRMKKRVGRKPKLLVDPTIMDRICDAVRIGCTFADACRAGGIGPSTMHAWLERAKDDGHPHQAMYQEFQTRLEHARADGKVEMVGYIRNAARGKPVHDKSGELVGYEDGDWRAAAHMLAIRDREGYAKKHHLEVTGKDGAPVGVNLYLPELEDEDDDDE